MLEIVDGMINANRNLDYGDAEDTFKDTANLLTALGYRHKDRDLEALDISIIYNALKLQRASVKPDLVDTWHDLTGYSAIGAAIATKYRELSEPSTIPMLP